MTFLMTDKSRQKMIGLEANFASKRGHYIFFVGTIVFVEFIFCKSREITSIAVESGFCMLFALSAYLKVFIVSDRSASVGLTQAIMQV